MSSQEQRLTRGCSDRPSAWHCAFVIARSQAENVKHRRKLPNPEELVGNKHSFLPRQPIAASTCSSSLGQPSHRPGMGLSACRAYPVCPGPRPSLTLQLRTHPSTVASQDSRNSRFLGLKQRVQRLSRDAFRELSPGPLHTATGRKDVTPSRPGPGLQGADSGVSQPRGRLATLPHRWYPGVLSAACPHWSLGTSPGQASLCRDGVREV